MSLAETRYWQGLQAILSVILTVKTLEALINKDYNLGKLIFCIIGTEEPHSILLGCHPVSVI